MAKNNRLMKIIIIIVFIPICLISVIPLWTIFVASFTQDKAIADYGYQLWFKAFSLEAYEYLFVNPDLIVDAYLISIIVTSIGTVLGVFFMSMLAYTMAHRKFKLAKGLGFYVLIPMLFSSGVVPYYILVTQYLHLKNTIWILIFPYLINPFSIMILRSNFRRLPQSLFEAAELDGAGEFQRFFKIALPLSIPTMATIALFSAITYWNDMYQALLFIDKQNLYPLPYLLYRMIFEHNIIQEAAQYTGIITPYQSVRMAVAVLSLIPELFLFMFAQRFFIRGITLGALKGE
ncbi:MAG TPA: carbohydrate ABC transporter permease [bacterium]|nr:carbohydrate ABC transporter permease [bacterium]